MVREYFSADGFVVLNHLTTFVRIIFISMGTFFEFFCIRNLSSHELNFHCALPQQYQRLWGSLIWQIYVTLLHVTTQKAEQHRAGAALAENDGIPAANLLLVNKWFASVIFPSYPQYDFLAQHMANQQEMFSRQLWRCIISMYSSVISRLWSGRDENYV